MIINLRRRQGPLCSHIVLYFTPFHICIVVYYMLFTTSEFLDRNHYFVHLFVVVCLFCHSHLSPFYCLFIEPPNKSYMEYLESCQCNQAHTGVDHGFGFHLIRPKFVVYTASHYQDLRCFWLFWLKYNHLKDRIENFVSIFQQEGFLHTHIYILFYSKPMLWIVYS